MLQNNGRCHKIKYYLDTNPEQQQYNVNKIKFTHSIQYISTDQKCSRNSHFLSTIICRFQLLHTK